MQYLSKYLSPIGEIILTADDFGLTGLWFAEDDGSSLSIKKTKGIFSEVFHWLDIYFQGEEPDFIPKLHVKGTSFQLEVWDILKKIPYGETCSYGEIAKIISKKMGIKKMSAQAVGGAVGKNMISIIIPCHRVIGTNGCLTGYGGGLDRKLKLLELEKVPIKIYPKLDLL